MGLLEGLGSKDIETTLRPRYAPYNYQLTHPNSSLICPLDGPVSPLNEPFKGNLGVSEEFPTWTPRDRRG